MTKKSTQQFGTIKLIKGQIFKPSKSETIVQIQFHRNISGHCILHLGNNRGLYLGKLFTGHEFMATFAKCNIQIDSTSELKYMGTSPFILLHLDSNL